LKFQISDFSFPLYEDLDPVRGTGGTLAPPIQLGITEGASRIGTGLALQLAIWLEE